MNHQMRVGQPTSTVSQDWSNQCVGFVKHWRSLITDAPFPHLHEFLDTPAPALQPQVFMFELVALDKTVFRLMATDLVAIWGGDFTGKAAEEVFTPEVARHYFADPRDCFRNRCGLWERGVFGDVRGREIHLEIVYLPLTTPPQKPQRLVGLLGLTEPTAKLASRRGLIAIDQRSWIDIGHGTPDNAPEIFSV